MILAAGLGTRLGPHTRTRPKALIEVGGVPMLELVARRLIEAGADRLIVNVHHFADQIERFLEMRDGFGAEVRISRETERPLDTGGGLAAAAPLFDGEEPFYLHNADILSDMDLDGLYASHLSARPRPMATLAVNERSTTRPLLLDDDGVYGVANRETGWHHEAREARSGVRERGFTGVHVVAPELLGRLTERGAFSLRDAYMRLIAEGERIAAYDVTGASWWDIGSPEKLARARRAAGPPEPPPAGEEGC